MHQDNELIIRPMEEKDLLTFWELAFKDHAPEWKKWDAPYYPHVSKSFEEFSEDADQWLGRDNFWAVEVNGHFVGIVSYYWEDEASKWLETGIVLYQAENWNRQIGTRAFRMWFDHLFRTLPIVRVGFATWSGNERMIRVGEKLGMKMEARIRRVRYYEGHYYDSIRMGILREEWENKNGHVRVL